MWDWHVSCHDGAQGVDLVFSSDHPHLCLDKHIFIVLQILYVYKNFNFKIQNVWYFKVKDKYQNFFKGSSLQKKICQMLSLDFSLNKDLSILPCFGNILWWSSKIGLAFWIAQYFWQVWIQIVPRFSHKIFPF